MDGPKPRIMSTTQPLPFAQLTPDAFERLCYWLVRREYGFDRVEHTGASGHDLGRDICAWRGTVLTVFQCKRRQALHRADIEKEIRAILSAAATQPADICFLLACDATLEVRGSAEECGRKHGVTCRLICRTELDEQAKRHPDVLREFFAIDPGGAPQPDLRIVDTPVRAAQLRFPHRTDFIGQDLFFPLVDLHLKNSGDDVAFISQLEIAVLEVQVNPSPILEFYATTTKTGDLVLEARNCGWGPAIDARIDHLQGDDLRQCLGLRPMDYFRAGTIEAGAAVESLTIPASAIARPARGPLPCPSGFVTCSDQRGVEHAFEFRYTPYPYEDVLIALHPGRFEVVHRDLARAREPSARYNVMLETEPSSYVKVFQISHEVRPKETERIQVVVAADRSADVSLTFRLRYDGMVVESPAVRLSIINPNSLWYYSYLKPSWAASSAPSRPGHGATEAFVRQVFGRDGDTFPEVYLHGEQLIETREADLSETERHVAADKQASALAYNNVAWVLIDQGLDVDEGMRMAGKADQLTPHDPYILDTLAMGHYKRGAFDHAVECWSRAQSLGLDDEELRDNLSKARAAAERGEGDPDGPTCSTT